jgi:chromosome partitioning protein
MILVVGNIKGGVGKTTLALNIAIARSFKKKDVLLIDGDEQQTATMFTDLRASIGGNVGYTSVKLNGKAIRTQGRQLSEKYDDLIIDVGGRDTGSLRAALTIADTLLIPVQPRSFDIWAVDQIADLVKEAREVNDLKALVVLNAADAQGKDNEEALSALREIEGLIVLDHSIGRRKIFPNAASLGKSIMEHTTKDQRALEEFEALMTSLYPL